MEKSDFKVVFSSKYAKGLFTFRAKKDPRNYLMGIHVMPHQDGGVVISATDGHRAVIIHDADGYADGEYILPLDRPVVSAATKIKHGPKRIGFICFDGSKLIVATHDLFVDSEELNAKTASFAQYADPIFGRYPRMGRLLKGVGEPSFGAVYVNPSYMADAAAFCVGPQGISFRVQDKDKPLFAVTGIHDEVVIFIMPMRTMDCSALSMPSFCDELIEAYELEESEKQLEETEKAA